MNFHVFKFQIQFSKAGESRVKESKVKGSIVNGQRVNESPLIGVTRWDNFYERLMQNRAKITQNWFVHKNRQRIHIWNALFKQRVYL